MFSSLRVKNFRLYWSGMLLSLIGTWIQTVAQSWLVFELTKSAFLLGVVGFLSSIPMFVLSLFGGVVADRANKRNLLIYTQLAFMALAFILAILTQLDQITPFQIMVIALLNGMVMSFDMPARQALVVELVGKEHLPNAIALNSVAFNSSRMIGPALAGIFIAGLGMSSCFYINGISFIAVIIALLLIKVGRKDIRKSAKSSLLKDLGDGLNFIKGNRVVLVLISIVGIFSLFGFSYILLMPIFANEVLKVGIKGLGILMSASGFGALAGGLVLAGFAHFRNKGRFLIFSSFIFAFSLMFFAFSRSYLFSLVMLVFLGWSGVSSVALINTLLQHISPDEVRGRVMSAFMFTFAGIMPFGSLLSGVLAHNCGVSWTIFLGGVICVLFFTVINTLYPEIRKLK